MEVVHGAEHASGGSGTGDQDMPLGRMQPDPPRDAPKVPSPDGARCDLCQKLMVSYLMTVADHLAWERGMKCATCYRGSLFEDPGDKQRTAFDNDVAERTKRITQTAQTFSPPAPVLRKFPAIEGTFDLHALGLTIRVWFKQDDLSLLDYHELMHEIAKPLSRRAIEKNFMSANEIIRLIADMPGVSAVQVQGARLALTGDTYHFEYQPGVVGYVEWP